ncbi:hypothetical protein C8Q72DRAFT_653989 [Fomitopsis betulina]|nr:hypothetical protein C8Q72DRAFT_653989 [Fomitopsis betulina]
MHSLSAHLFLRTLRPATTSCLGRPSRGIFTTVGRVAWSRRSSGRNLLSQRSLATSASESSSTTTNTEQRTTESSDVPADVAEDAVYYGPLTNTFRRLKIFSLSSLALTASLTPFIFMIETASSLPLSGRFALAGVALATSGVSTGLVAWAGKPYVTKLRWIETGPGVEMTTLTLRLREQTTRVYDTAFLAPATRPLATVELAEASQLPADEIEEGKKHGSLPREETIAETMTPGGVVVGRWIVQWDGEGKGTCRAVGKVVKHFNIHQELLDRPIR